MPHKPGHGPEYKSGRYPSTPSTRAINRMDSFRERARRIRKKLKEAGHYVRGD